MVMVQKVLRDGDTSKPNPFTICIIANRLLEAPRGSGQYIVDPITANQQDFDACAQYIVDCLYGSLPSQKEAVLADPSIGPYVKIVTIFDNANLDPNGADRHDNSFIAQDSTSFLLVANRIKIKNYVMSVYGQVADIVYAVSGSSTHTRASAWYTTDDPSNVGKQFILDGNNLVHCHDCAIPGTIAIHHSAKSLVALHEFSHALSSYGNGMILDLYVNNNPAVNCKNGRPIPATFGTYATATLSSDAMRDHLGYPAHWTSYHCERNGIAPHGPDLPAVMDDYYQVPVIHQTVECEHDVITRTFLRDRLLAKVARP